MSYLYDSFCVEPMQTLLSRYNLPAGEIASEVNRTLEEKGALVITAPPGAGKSTLLPLTMLRGYAPEGRILVLEPRRIAARQIAQRMSEMIGEPVGGTVGYRVRFETRVGPKTRIEVLTEGILTRMIADDPTLDGVSVVIFDEFHERNLNSDVALALVRATRDAIRPDLRIVLMSATIDATKLSRELDAPVIESPGRCYPVELRYTGDNLQEQDIARAVAGCVRTALNDTQGDVLAFLPGEAQIRQCADLLAVGLPDVRICPLYGMLPFDRQKEAIQPSRDGMRRVVLATPVAETSLTIEGVCTVVDSGFCKKMVFNPQNGLSRLETVRISMDMADQRSGRAGRLAPGVCYRMWNEAVQSRMEPFRKPEILEADLAPVVLDVARWGGAPVDSLDWITPPPAYSLASALSLLTSLGAFEADRQALTEHGMRLASMPCHPRVAQMFLASDEADMKALAADIAALLDDRDPMSSGAFGPVGADLCERVDALRRMRSSHSGFRSGAWTRMAAAAQQYRRLVRCDEDNSSVDMYKAGFLLANAWPMRLARAVPGRLGVYQMASGDLGILDPADTLCSFEWIVAADVSSNRDGQGRIHLAAPVAPEDLGHMTVERLNMGWDSRRGMIVARRERRIGSLVLSACDISDLTVDQRVEAISAAAPKDGLSMFDFNDDVAMLQRRLDFAREPGGSLPATDTQSVLACCAGWLPMYIGSARTAADLKKIDMCRVIWNMLTYEQQMMVDRVAPSHVTLPSGKRLRLEYRHGAEAPILRVRLQECFGMQDGPRVNEGRTAVLMELLSPGFKPVQLTSDLRSFWSGTYFEVRRELKRRYPKHAWPEDPMAVN